MLPTLIAGELCSGLHDRLPRELPGRQDWLDLLHAVAALVGLTDRRKRLGGAAVDAVLGGELDRQSRPRSRSGTEGMSTRRCASRPTLADTACPATRHEPGAVAEAPLVAARPNRTTIVTDVGRRRGSSRGTSSIGTSSPISAGMLIRRETPNSRPSYPSTQNQVGTATRPRSGFMRTLTLGSGTSSRRSATKTRGAMAARLVDGGSVTGGSSMNGGSVGNNTGGAAATGTGSVGASATGGAAGVDRPARGREVAGRPAPLPRTVFRQAPRRRPTD